MLFETAAADPGASLVGLDGWLLDVEMLKRASAASTSASEVPGAPDSTVRFGIGKIPAALGIGMRDIE